MHLERLIYLVALLTFALSSFWKSLKVRLAHRLLRPKKERRMAWQPIKSNAAGSMQPGPDRLNTEDS